jgi:hypothetical protein
VLVLRSHCACDASRNNVAAERWHRRQVYRSVTLGGGGGPEGSTRSRPLHAIAPIPATMMSSDAGSLRKESTRPPMIAAPPARSLWSQGCRHRIRQWGPRFVTQSSEGGPPRPGKSSIETHVPSPATVSRIGHRHLTIGGLGLKNGAVCSSTSATTSKVDAWWTVTRTDCRGARPACAVNSATSWADLRRRAIRVSPGHLSGTPCPSALASTSATGIRLCKPRDPQASLRSTDERACAEDDERRPLPLPLLLPRNSAMIRVPAKQSCPVESHRDSS